MALGDDYGILITSNIPIIGRFARADTSLNALAHLGTIVCPVIP
jgi:hypothetical protein